MYACPLTRLETNILAPFLWHVCVYGNIGADGLAGPRKKAARQAWVSTQANYFLIPGTINRDSA